MGTARNDKSKNLLLLKLTIKKDPALDYAMLFKSEKAHSRSTTKVTNAKGSVTIEIKATDPTALRASANSVLRDLQVISATKLK